MSDFEDEDYVADGEENLLPWEDPPNPFDDEDDDKPKKKTKVKVVTSKSQPEKSKGKKASKKSKASSQFDEPQPKPPSKATNITEEDIYAALREKFGHPGFRSTIQEEAVKELCVGQRDWFHSIRLSVLTNYSIIL